MYTDLFGQKRVRIGLHHHSTRSDGTCTPEEVARRYADAGYDAIAITDHWVYGQEQALSGLHVLQGCEYDIGSADGCQGVYHIVCLFAEREPRVTKDMSAQQIIDAIHGAGGLAVLAHPAWSLNTPDSIRALKGIDATEIFNTVSGKGMSRRADSSLIVDMLACSGVFLPLLAADDSHYYGEGAFDDSCTAFIMVACDSTDPRQLRKAIVKGDFYASTGPEIHLSRKGNTVMVDCSPACEIVFMSNFTFSKDRAITGTDLTHGEYELKPGETYIRAFVTDAQGRQAWTNCIII